MWIAKLAVIRVFQRMGRSKAADGRMLYVNQAQGSSTEEHPLDEYFRTCWSERAEPYYSTLPYEQGEHGCYRLIRARMGRNSNGGCASTGVHRHVRPVREPILVRPAYRAITFDANELESAAAR